MRSMCSNYCKHVGRFITFATNIRNGSDNMPTTNINTFSDNILEYLRGLEVIRKPSNRVWRIWLISLILYGDCRSNKKHKRNYYQILNIHIRAHIITKFAIQKYMAMTHFWTHKLQVTEIFMFVPPMIPHLTIKKCTFWIEHGC